MQRKVVEPLRSSGTELRYTLLKARARRHWESCMGRDTDSGEAGSCRGESGEGGAAELAACDATGRVPWENETA